MKFNRNEGATAMIATAATRFTSTYAWSDDPTFELTEVEPGSKDFCGGALGATRRDAWRLAQSQAKPVVVIYLDGTRKELGVVWNAELAADAAFNRWASQEYADSDAAFRSSPRRSTWEAIGRPGYKEVA